VKGLKKFWSDGKRELTEAEAAELNEEDKDIYTGASVLPAPTAHIACSHACKVCARMSVDHPSSPGMIHPCETPGALAETLRELLLEPKALTRSRRELKSSRKVSASAPEVSQGHHLG
jgi:hypothetical protein